MHSRFTILNIYNKYIPGIHYKASRALLAHPRFSRGLIDFFVDLFAVCYILSINKPALGLYKVLKKWAGSIA